MIAKRDRQFRRIVAIPDSIGAIGQERPLGFNDHGVIPVAGIDPNTLLNRFANDDGIVAA